MKMIKVSDLKAFASTFFADPVLQLAVNAAAVHAPCVDAVETEPGSWLGEADGYADGELVYDVWYCSECNYCIDDGTDDPEMLPNYCPNCGKRMKEGEPDEKA